MKTYEESYFRDTPNIPKGFPSKLQALAAAETLEPKMKATAKETGYGWIVDIADGAGSTGSIVQNGRIHWWLGGELRARQRSAESYKRQNAPTEARWQ